MSAESRYDFLELKNYLVVGSGGREQAVAQEYAKLPYIPRIMIAPGNAGTEFIPHAKDQEVVNVPLPHNDVADIVDIAKREDVKIVFVGSEEWLKQGIGDILKEEGIRAIAPELDRAVLELDKTYTREMCSLWGVPQPKYAYFSNEREAMAFVVGHNLQDGVVKAAGPALGKGVTVCSSQEELLEAIKVAKANFGSAADKILIEERLVGREVSYIVITDGVTFVPLMPALDYKLLNGKNTGGMGAIAPNPYVTQEIATSIEDKIIIPIIDGMRNMGKPYKGVLYAGVMITDEGPKLIEINVRMGDPETQVQLPLMKYSLPEVFIALELGSLEFYSHRDKEKLGINWGPTEGASVLVMLAADGYPGTSRKGDIIHGLKNLPQGVGVIHSGTKKDEDGNIVVNGGRVLGVRASLHGGQFMANKNGFQDLVDKVYAAIGKENNGVHFDGMQKRNDVGKTQAIVSARKKFTYGSVVNYDPVDHLKMMAAHEAETTDELAKHFGFSTVPESRGESAFLVNMGDFIGVFVQEGLGTKGLIVNHLQRSEPPGRIQRIERGSWGRPEEARPTTFWEALPWDTVAAIANDAVAVGGELVIACPHWAAGDSSFFEDQERNTELFKGWSMACDAIGAMYGPGETSILNGVVNPETIELSGSGFGIIRSQNKATIGRNLVEGNHIVLIQSGGIHANGLSLARKIAAEILPKGYDELLPSGITFGRSLLNPTILYAQLQKKLFREGAEINYAVNITGHGFRKLMRAKQPFTYRLHTIPTPQEEFTFMKERANISEREMYATFNMGAGFAFYVPKDHASGVVKISRDLGLKAWDAGVVEDGPKQVIIEPKNIVYSAETLKIR